MSIPTFSSFIRLLNSATFTTFGRIIGRLNSMVISSAFMAVQARRLAGSSGSGWGLTRLSTRLGQIFPILILIFFIFSFISS
jgi:hypothetical protein